VGVRQNGAVSDGPATDGVVTLRPSTPGDAPLIVAGRDAAFRRFIGEGSAVPTPEFCIVVDGSVVGCAAVSRAKPTSGVRLSGSDA
jgi:hypothetical protein